ncbi:DUF484 family protein [Asticcacaulis endophyticus]|uniref:DUF484 family protein n=1 Tax=Asticcacaulis endophyticus TaxID=1395890 RepID=A0A918PW21_9CAUL|nr:DUF484 family protein [Asticcacaulis endophyticus]GGZ22948.1 hypothetical protein GCM10011273_04800 [Asticcacaulis endophyticus]
MATEISDSENAAPSVSVDDWAEVRARLPQFADKLKADRPLLDSLGLKPASRNLIDFGPAALSRLEAKALKDIDVRRQMEATARANFDAQNQTHGMVINLMEARNHSDLARRLNEEVKHRFGLMAATIALEDTGPVPLGWKTLDYGGVDYIIGEDALSLLGPDAVARVLFDEDVKRIKSAAALRISLWREGRPGLVSFGSADFDGFTPDMGAELVAFVARVVERVADRWPVL